jgi:Na+-transporting NADH:ubiquinone oxidoreductase subunit C
MKNKIYFPIIYMFIVTAFFSSVLIGFSKLTRKKVEANEKIAFEKAVVSVLPVSIDMDSVTSAEIHKAFTEKITQPVSGAGAYVLEVDGQIKGYAVPVSGKGFWAPIKGIVGIGADRKTLIGIAFYEQNETPGLGAEITKPEFCDQFKIQNNKVIADDKKCIRIVRAGTELGENEVYAVTGATQTSVRLEKLLNDGIVKWRNAMSGANSGNSE